MLRNCLKDRFDYPDEDIKPDSFVCPQCKGLHMKKRKRAEARTTTAAAPAVAPAAVRHHSWAPGDRVTVDYADGSAPYAGTVGSVGARGEVRVNFDDSSWATLAKPAERARLALQPGVQRAMPRASEKVKITGLAQTLGHL